LNVVRLTGAFTAMLAAAVFMAACEPDPWRTEPPLTVILDLQRGGVAVDPNDLRLAGSEGLRIVHRIDVFRPRDHFPQNHRRTHDCIPLETGNGGGTAPRAGCETLVEGPTGKTVTAAELQGGARAWIEQRGGVLEIVHRSAPQMPMLYDVTPSASVIAQVTFSGADRYWAKYWAACPGCLGFVSMEVRLGQDVWCPVPVNLAGIPAQTQQLTLSLDLDNPAARRDGATTSTSDGVLCGEPSWFEAFHREGIVTYRP
jgi:hypothetical protein